MIELAYAVVTIYAAVLTVYAVWLTVRLIRLVRIKRRWLLGDGVHSPMQAQLDMSGREHGKIGGFSR